MQRMAYDRVLDDALQLGACFSELVMDVSGELHRLRTEGKRILYEGAQGSLLDIDHGTYPFVTSSNTTIGAVCTGAGVGPSAIDYVLGITKAYTTRVGSGPFPTELFDDVGAGIAERGVEFGATTGRPRRCGWLDAVALRRAAHTNGVSGFCVTKLDVLDGMETIKVGIAYRLNGELLDVPPQNAEAWDDLEVEYETFPGWKESTRGITRFRRPAGKRQNLYRRNGGALRCAGAHDLHRAGPEREHHHCSTRWGSCNYEWSSGKKPQRFERKSSDHKKPAERRVF